MLTTLLERQTKVVDATTSQCASLRVRVRALETELHSLVLEIAGIRALHLDSGSPPSPALESLNDRYERERYQCMKEEMATMEDTLATLTFQQRQYTFMASRLHHNGKVMDAYLKSLDAALGVAAKEKSDRVSQLRRMESEEKCAREELEAFTLACALARREGEEEERALTLASERFEEGVRSRGVRRVVRAELLAEMRGDLSGDQEALLLATVAQKRVALALVTREKRSREALCTPLLAAYETLRQTTGVSSLTGIAQMFVSAPGVRAALEGERGVWERSLVGAQDRVEGAKRGLQALEKALAEGGAANATTTTTTTSSSSSTTQCEEEEGEVEGEGGKGGRKGGDSITSTAALLSLANELAKETKAVEALESNVRLAMDASIHLRDLFNPLRHLLFLTPPTHTPVPLSSPSSTTTATILPVLATTLPALPLSSSSSSFPLDTTLGHLATVQCHANTLLALLAFSMHEYLSDCVSWVGGGVGVVAGGEGEEGVQRGGIDARDWRALGGILLPPPPPPDFSKYPHTPPTPQEQERQRQQHHFPATWAKGFNNSSSNNTLGHARQLRALVTSVSHRLLHRTLNPPPTLTLASPPTIAASGSSGATSAFDVIHAPSVLTWSPTHPTPPPLPLSNARVQPMSSHPHPVAKVGAGGAGGAQSWDGQGGERVLDVGSTGYSVGREAVIALHRVGRGGEDRGGRGGEINGDSRRALAAAWVAAKVKAGIGLEGEERGGRPTSPAPAPIAAAGGGGYGGGLLGGGSNSKVRGLREVIKGASYRVLQGVKQAAEAAERVAMVAAERVERDKKAPAMLNRPLKGEVGRGDVLHTFPRLL